MANLADDDLLLVQRTSAGISTNYSITGSALKEDLTGVTGLIANPVEVLTPLDGSGLSGDINYYPETSTVTDVEVLSFPARDYSTTLLGMPSMSAYEKGLIFTTAYPVYVDLKPNEELIFDNLRLDAGPGDKVVKYKISNGSTVDFYIQGFGSSGYTLVASDSGPSSGWGEFEYTIPYYAKGKIHYASKTGGRAVIDGFFYQSSGEQLLNSEAYDHTKLTLTNDKVFDSSNSTEMSTVDQVLTAGMVVEGESDSTVLTPAFSTTLYPGNDGTQDINTGIDNRIESLVWIKSRNDVGGGGNYHFLVDTVRGGGQFLMSNIKQGSTGASPSIITTFNDNGYSLDTGSGVQNESGANYVSWNWRSAPGFFDIVTFSGSGTLNQNRRISHSLGSAPGMIIVKELGFVLPEKDWYVYHSSNGVDSYQALNNGTKATSGFNAWGTSPTSTDFGINEDNLSTSSGDYIAYLFADTPGLIKCGSYTGAGVGTSVDVGFRPSWVLIKSSNYNDTNWVIADSSRSGEVLWANTTDAAYPHSVSFTDTGFTLDSNSSYYNTSGYTYTYVAIADNAMAGDFPPTGTLIADANPSDPSITLEDVTGTWTSGMTAVGQTQLTEYAPGPEDITFTSMNNSTTPFTGTDATLAFRRWTLESRASAGDPWVVVDTYEDYDIVASQDGATPWSSNKPTLAPNTMYRVKVAYISTNADPVESVYNTFTTGSN